MKRFTLLLAGAVLAAGLCAGCQEKFTRQRYETIYVGQPAAEVELTLGEPKAKFSDSWSYIHEDPFYKAIIKFSSGRVSDKAWYDEHEMGENPDLKDAPGERKIIVEQQMVVD